MVDVGKIVELLLRYKKEFGEMWTMIEDIVYERHGSDYSKKMNVLMRRLKHYCEEYYSYVIEELKKDGVDVSVFSDRTWWNVIERAVLDWLSYDYVIDKNPPLLEDVVIYGETMGFIKEGGGEKWKVFEGSDEPGEVDVYLYNRLILKGSVKKLVLYGMHGEEFVESWRERGIPRNVYFASERGIAERYWHGEGGDVLVKVTIPEGGVVPTGEGEYKTIRVVEPHEFELKVINYY